MAVPKRKHSNSRTGHRRSHHALKPKQLMSCRECSKAVPSHIVCPKLRLLHGAYRSASGKGVVLSKLAFLFPGQGAQTVGMGRGAFERVPSARQLFERAEQVLGYDLAQVCFEGPATASTPPSAANRHCLCAVWRPWKCSAPRPPSRIADCQLAAGLSLGEYTAITFAGNWISSRPSAWYSGVARPCKPRPTQCAAAW